MLVAKDKGDCWEVVDELPLAFPWEEPEIFYINTRTEMKANDYFIGNATIASLLFSIAWAVNYGTQNVFDPSSMSTDTSYLNNV